MRVVFTDLARRRLHEIQSYIAFDNIRAAVKVVHRIIYTAELLGDHPHLGTLWRGGPTRAFGVSRLRYRVDLSADTVTILTVRTPASCHRNSIEQASRAGCVQSVSYPAALKKL